MTNCTTYYSMTPIQHENVHYEVGDKIELTAQQAQHLYLTNKITTCSRAAQLIKNLKEALKEHTTQEAGKQVKDTKEDKDDERDD